MKDLIIVISVILFYVFIFPPLMVYGIKFIDKHDLWKNKR